MKTKSVGMEASKLIHGPRRKSYGNPRESFSKLAAVWSAVLGVTSTPEQVALCMVGLKLIREANRHQRDNLVDLCGYAELANELYEYDKSEK